jgi:hypothetical protein
MPLVGSQNHNGWEQVYAVHESQATNQIRKLLARGRARVANQV